MASLPLLSSRDGVEIVAALLGHARAAPSEAANVRILDSIFNDVIDSLRIGLPLRAEIEAGAAAVASLLNALQERADIGHTSRAYYSANGSYQPHELRAQQQSFGHHLRQQPYSHPYPHAENTQNAQLAAPTKGPMGSLAVEQPPHQSGPTSAQTPLSADTHPSTPQSQPHQRQQQPQLQLLHLTNPNGRYPAVSPILPAGLTYSQGATVQGVNHFPQHAPGPDARPVRRPPRKKRYHDAVPSTHCHICCRPSTAVPMAVCSNIKEGTCRKVVCNRCISDNGWDWEQASSESSRWICPHCTDSCTKVPRAQCWVYMRTNSRRRMNGLRKKARTLSEAVVSAGPATSTSVSNGPYPSPPPAPSPASVGFRPLSVGATAVEYHGSARGHSTLTPASAHTQPSDELPPARKPEDSSALAVRSVVDGNGKKAR